MGKARDSVGNVGEQKPMRQGENFTHLRKDVDTEVQRL